MKRDGARRFVRAAGLVGGVLLALSPVVARAQQSPAPYATGVLYEVDETINCNPGDGVDPLCLQRVAEGFGTRIADATLVGTVDGPVEFSGPITVEASSILSQIDWTGPAHGKIWLQTANGTVNANMAGQLDLSLLQKHLALLAPISGKWHGIKGFGVGGSFTGLFEVPFMCGETRACYVENGVVIPAERPLVKLVVTFYNN